MRNNISRKLESYISVCYLVVKYFKHMHDECGRTPERVVWCFNIKCVLASHTDK